MLYVFQVCLSVIFSSLGFIKLLKSSGQRVCLADNQYVGGAGTYTRQGYITSCLAGVVKVTSQPDKVSGQSISNSKKI